jgi:dTDP-glucose pyrophosphorylase/predicted transcriptional regulator
MFRTAEELNSVIVNKDVSIRDAVKIIDKNGFRIVHLVDEKEILKGIFTDSDFRRVVIKRIDLSDPLSTVINNNPKVIESSKAEKEYILSKIKKHHINQLPIVNRGKIVDLFVESDLIETFDQNKNIIEEEIPVFILAGGKGKRLEPITKIIPKPLIPIGNKTIIELIMDKFTQYGLKQFYLSINYKANIIKAFFNDNPSNYDIKYVIEKKYLGTIGSLKLLDNQINTPMFISNCDVLLDVNYSSTYDFHLKNNNDLTLVGSMIHQSIPYGVCMTTDSGEILEIKEKPEIDYLVNVGCYIMNNVCIDFIPEDQYYDITDLNKVLKKEGMKIGIYPISQDSWVDIGQMKEYREILKGF